RGQAAPVVVLDLRAGHRRPGGRAHPGGAVRPRPLALDPPAGPGPGPLARPAPGRYSLLRRPQMSVSTPPAVLGLDVGGANLKSAHVGPAGPGARSLPFALWRLPADLAGALRDLVGPFPPADVVAVTMTGELCDCFADKREGVHAILGAVAQAA